MTPSKKPNKVSKAQYLFSFPSPNKPNVRLQRNDGSFLELDADEDALRPLIQQGWRIVDRLAPEPEDTDHDNS